MKDPESVERHDRIRDLYERASALPAGQRSAFLAQTCGGDTDLQQEVSSLLEESEATDSPFGDLVTELIQPALHSLSRDSSCLENWLEDCLEFDAGETDPMVGKTVSHFEILAPIGRGGMGMVYRAVDRNLDRTVALKFLPPSLSSDPDAKERFIHEAKAASGLNHPHIATVYEIGETGDHQLFIAMGYYPGMILSETIKEGPIPSGKALDIAIQLATGLKEAHGHGVIHRDIKPGNVMVSAEGGVVLLDFGLAKLSHEIGYTQVGQMAGTIAYMSPEQARGEKVDQRSDIWSFGVVFYEALTGRPPFSGDNAQTVIRTILEDDPALPVTPDGEVPDPLKDILGLCLAKDPDRRYQTAEDLLLDLQRAREGLVPKKRGGRATWKRRAHRRRLVGLSVGAVLVLAITLLVVQNHEPVSSEEARTSDPLRPAAGLVRVRDQIADSEDQSIQILKDQFRQNPQDAGTSMSLATIYDASLNRYDEAMSWYRRALALGPENPAVPSGIAGLYAKMGDLETADWWIQLSLKTAPESELKDLRRVQSHLFRGEMDAALEIVRSGPADDPVVWSASFDLVLEALLDSGQIELAQGLCRQFRTAYLDLSPPGDGHETFRVVVDPFGQAANKVLAFDPDARIGEVPETDSPLLSTRHATHLRAAALRLPAAEEIAAEGSGRGRYTLYLKVGRSGDDGSSRDMDAVWGLASGAGFTDYGTFNYGDYSIVARIHVGRRFEFRDGESYRPVVDSGAESDVFYELWFVVDHAALSYDLHVRGGDDFPEQTLVCLGAKYRKEARTDLDHFVIRTYSGIDFGNPEGYVPVYFDDIHMDLRGENLGDPDGEWTTIDDFEDGDVSNWLVRLRNPDSVLDMAHVRSAYLVARTLYGSGEFAQAEEILASIEVAIEYAWRPDWNPHILTMTRIHALRGDREKTLTGIRRLIDSGKINWYRKELLETGEFAKFSDDTAFRDLIAGLDENLDSQLKRIRIAEGRGTYVPVPDRFYGARFPAQVDFTPVTDTVLTEDRGQFLGFAWGDYDNDGFVDLALAGEKVDQSIGLFRNNRDGTFDRISEGVLITDRVSPSQPVWADQDNDGDLDLFVSSYHERPDAFYRNEGGGVFHRVTRGAWVRTPGSGDNPTWGDYDGDGWVDLYVAIDQARDRLYRNRGDGTMEPVDTEPSRQKGWSNGCAWSDYDNDGDLDLFLSGQNKVQFRNDGVEGFTWISDEDGGIPSHYTSLAISTADYDNDGDLDVLYNRHDSGKNSRLYRNEGAGGFVDITRIIPSGGVTSANAAAWGDYDNDGHLDLYVANSGGANQLYHNNGDGSFTPVIKDPVVRDLFHSGRTEWVDYDNDGDLDLFVANGIHTEAGQYCQLFRNEGGPNSWIVFDLEGTVSNRSAVGAKIRATATIDGRTVTQLREIHGSGSDLRVHFGFGDATAIETLRIEWPSGIVQILRDVAVNQFLNVVEAKPDGVTNRRSMANEVPTGRGMTGNAGVLPPTSSRLAYDLYLKSIDLDKMEGETEASTLRKKAMLEQALREDPVFVEAWARLKRLYDLMVKRAVDRGWFLADGQDEATVLAELKENSRLALAKAVALDPSNSQTQLAMAIDHVWPKSDERMQEVGRILDGLIENDPGNAEAWFHLGWYYQDLMPDQMDHAFEAWEEALRLDPFNARMVRSLHARYLFLGDQKNIERLAERLGKIAPELGYDRWQAQQTALNRLWRIRIDFQKTGDEALIEAYRNVRNETMDDVENPFYRDLIEHHLRLYTDELDRILAIASAQSYDENLPPDLVLEYLAVQFVSLAIQVSRGQQSGAEEGARKIIEAAGHPVLDKRPRIKPWLASKLALATFVLGDEKEALELAEGLVKDPSLPYDPYQGDAVEAMAWVDPDRAVELVLRELAEAPDWAHLGRMAEFYFYYPRILANEQIQALYLKDGRWIEFLAKRLPEFAALATGSQASR